MFDIFLSFACSKKFIPGGLTYTEIKMWTRDNHILSYRAYLWLYDEILGALKNTITFVKLFLFSDNKLAFTVFSQLHHEKPRGPWKHRLHGLFQAGVSYAMSDRVCH